MTERCDLCASMDLEPAYRPPSSRRGLCVHVCRFCGLVQSLPRIDHVQERQVAISGEADWGNVRYGKGFRTEQAFVLLDRVIGWTRLRRCLDVGSSRGSFVSGLMDRAPQARVTAVEPDSGIVDSYSNLPQVELHVNRIEELDLPAEEFDLIYCSHTLEHLASPKDFLGQARGAIKPGGVLFLEVPRLEFIGRDDVIEEWFIDKHLYHFSAGRLKEYVAQAGFDVEQVWEDLENIGLIARAVDREKRGEHGEREKREKCESQREGQPENEREESAGLIARYQATRSRNQAALGAAARCIESLARTSRVVVWGAGRLFDCLVRYGSLDVSLLAGIVDKHLHQFAETVHSREVLSPARIAELKPDLTIVASRAYYEEIREELRSLHPGCRGLSLHEVLATSEVTL